MNSYYEGTRSEMIPFLPEKYSKVLEIGCGEGNFSAQLTKAVELWGIEPIEDVGSIAAQKLHKVLLGKYDQLVKNLPDNYFDLIICNDVIEHMEDHDWFLESIKEKLAINGRLLISIPNVRHIRNVFNFLIMKDWKYQDAFTLDRTHLRFFTEKSIKRTLKEHHFIIEEFRGINESNNPLFRFLLNVLGIMSLGNLSDTKYFQFAIRVKKGS